MLCIHGMKRNQLDPTWPSTTLNRSFLIALISNCAKKIIQKTYKNIMLFYIFWYAACQPGIFQNESKMIPKTLKWTQDRHLGCILRSLGKHLDPSWRSWSRSCCRKCRNIVPTWAKTAQLRANIVQSCLCESCKTSQDPLQTAMLTKCSFIFNAEVFQNPIALKNRWCVLLKVVTA